MKIKDLKEILLGVNINYNVFFKVGENKCLSFNLIEISQSTKELIFRKADGVDIDLKKNLKVGEILPLLMNLEQNYTVVFEDIEEPAETFNIDSIDISFLHNQVIIKHWIQ